MIDRPARLAEIRSALRRVPVVALVGPRQSGKTTLARQIVPADSEAYFDLEDPRALARLEQPMLALEPLRGTVVLDEVQRRADLFPILRVLADRRPVRTRFLVLGSASPALLRQSSETLAGRLETIVLPGLSLEEVGTDRLERLWMRGGFPPSLLARTGADSFAWRLQLIQTFLERDLPGLGVSGPAPMLLRLWTMIAHYHGNIWNAAEPARSLGVSAPTIRRYLDLLSALYLVRQLQPWHENLAKRQVKAPKIYLRDSGLLHALLGIQTSRELSSHPKVGASWEGFALEEVLKVVRPAEAFFWSAHTGAELDLLLLYRGRRWGVEFKYSDAPRLTPSMRTALKDLRLDGLTVIYPGSQEYALDRGVDVLPLAALASGDPRVVVGRKDRRVRVGG